MVRKEQVRIGMANDQMGPQPSPMWAKVMVCQGCQFHGWGKAGHHCLWPGYKRPRGQGDAIMAPDWCPVMLCQAEGQDPSKVIAEIEAKKAEALAKKGQA